MSAGPFQVIKNERAKRRKLRILEICSGLRGVVVEALRRERRLGVSE